MRILLTLGLACCTLTAMGAKQSNRPDVKLVVTMDIAAPEQQPILVIHIVNQSARGSSVNCARRRSIDRKSSGGLSTLRIDIS